ncbi:hypothetical protein ACHAXR_012404 [Thalassiosira sp. AJA248-18]
MCGIGLLASFPAVDNTVIHNALLLDWNERLSESLASRGPDVPCRQCHFNHGNIDININNVAPPTAADMQWSAGVTLHASVLHMRGHYPVAQPLSFPPSSVPTPDNIQVVQNCALCWNGECYTYCDKVDEEGDGIHTECRNGNMVELISTTASEEESDTVLVTKLVQQAIDQSQYSDMGEHEAIANAMSRIHGEYSFILFVPSSASSTIESNKNGGTPGYVYYGRDFLGRRSLLVNKSVHGVVAVSSVAIDGGDFIGKNWEEIPPGIVYRLDVYTGEESSLPIPRVINKETLGTLMPPIESIEKRTARCTLEPTVSDGAQFQKSPDDAAENLLKLLDRAVKRRVMQAPPPKSQSTSDASVAVLFSGGIDSVVLAALCHRHVPLNDPIDLINVTFYASNAGRNDPPTSPDRLAAILSYHEMKYRFPDRIWRFIAVDVPYQEVLDQEEHILRLISPLDSTMDFNIATAFWFAGRGKGRILGVDEVEAARRGLERKAGVCHENSSIISPKEPLLRFAIEDKANNVNGSPKTRPTCIREGCTRLAPHSGCVFQACKWCCGKLQGPISSYLGKSARLCPAHNHIVGQSKSNGMQKEPSSDEKTKTTTQPSPSYCLRIDGNETNICTVTSNAKVLLSGVGADEQMAGYGRHRTTYQRGGYEALHAELDIEVNRLWTRNLGRDDRVLSDHGKEARFPYLDEDVMAYLKVLPIEKKCDMTRPLGEGDKLILRKVARMIGVVECSSLVKRAIQFGSRIAKVSDKSRFGSCRQATGQSKIVSAKDFQR